MYIYIDMLFDFCSSSQGLFVLVAPLVLFFNFIIYLFVTGRLIYTWATKSLVFSIFLEIFRLRY